MEQLEEKPSWKGMENVRSSRFIANVFSMYLHNVRNERYGYEEQLYVI